MDDADHGNLPQSLRGGQSTDDSATRRCYGLVPMAQAPAPSARKLVGIASILLLIMVWAAFVASLAQVVGQWPVLVQAPFYLIMGVAWIIPLKPLIRWSQTGSFRAS